MSYSVPLIRMILPICKEVNPYFQHVIHIFLHAIFRQYKMLCSFVIIQEKGGRITTFPTAIVVSPAIICLTYFVTAITLKAMRSDE